MSTRTDIDESDEGKTVVGPNGEEVGRIVSVEHGTAHVDPDPGITETVKSKLGWGDRDEDTYPLQEAAVGSITDDEVHLQSL
ncbi:PRC-barrel domain containing protein [Halomarina oriensis]|uniref:PRC-barrel domain containing protein n=1 Tax=Halomarina oriensis TaxID=671145 RepID=A0A6B0GPA5_9EURY|nr:PRC-barrel domain containing protein [Halomarina oriensis]MWG34503.1 PRC-barrel domain containing protein [Halomarina oriensis]